MRSGAREIRLLWSDSCSTCSRHLDRAKRLINKSQTNECHCSLQHQRTAPPPPPPHPPSFPRVCHIMRTLDQPPRSPPPIYDRFFLAYPAVLQVSSFSEPLLVPVDLSGGVIHRETFTRGERRDYFLVFFCFGAAVPMPRCSFQVLQYALCLTERDRSVSGFPIISGRSLPRCQQTEPSFLSVCRS